MLKEPPQLERSPDGKLTVDSFMSILKDKPKPNFRNQINVGWPSYMTGKFTQFQELNRDLKKEARCAGVLLSKKVDSNKAGGVSVDFPLKAGSHQQVHPNTVSIYEPKAIRTGSLDSGAGLSNNNSIHTYMCYNGKKDKPQIFANLLKNCGKAEMNSVFADISRFDGKTKFAETPAGIREHFFRQNRHKRLRSEIGSLTSNKK